MSGWGMACWTMVSATGVLVFLTVVAHAVNRIHVDARRRAEQAARRRAELGDGLQEPGTSLESAA